MFFKAGCVNAATFESLSAFKILLYLDMKIIYKVTCLS